MFKKGSESPLYGQIDERTKAVVYQGDAYTGRFMLFAVLIDVFIRGFKFFDPITASNWDLMFIVIAGSFISTVYQIKNRVMFSKPYFRGILYIVMVMAVCALIAFMLIMFIK